MNPPRWLKHLCYPEWLVHKALPKAVMHRIEAVIRQVETTHHGQIRFAVEPSLELAALLKGQTARERAVEVFSRLRVWDTEHNNGVLIYLLLAEHDVEIVADRGIHAKVGEESWKQICSQMEQALRQGNYAEGVIHGVREVGRLLSLHFPARAGQHNELPDAPVIL